jgi:hypothetical protein
MEAECCMSSFHVTGVEQSEAPVGERCRTTPLSPLNVRATAPPLACPLQRRTAVTNQIDSEPILGPRRLEKLVQALSQPRNSTSIAM